MPTAQLCPSNLYFPPSLKAQTLSRLARAASQALRGAQPVQKAATAAARFGNWSSGQHGRGEIKVDFRGSFKLPKAAVGTVEGNMHLRLDTKRITVLLTRRERLTEVHWPKCLPRVRAWGLLCTHSTWPRCVQAACLNLPPLGRSPPPQEQAEPVLPAAPGKQTSPHSPGLLCSPWSAAGHRK